MPDDWAQIRERRRASRRESRRARRASAEMNERTPLVPQAAAAPVPEYTSGTGSPKPNLDHIRGSLHEEELMRVQRKATAALRAALGQGARPRDLFAEFDKDGDGAITRAEFAAAMEKLNFPLTSDEVRMLLDAYDEDHSGEIELDEFLQLAERAVDEVPSGLLSQEQLSQLAEMAALARQQSSSSDDEDDSVASDDSDASAQARAAMLARRSARRRSPLARQLLKGVKMVRAMFEVYVTIVFTSVAMGVNIFPEELSSQTTMGVALVMTSTLVSQLAFTFTSGFECAIGYQLAEVIPFLGQIVNAVIADMDVDAESSADQLPTIMFAFFVSSSVVALCHFVIGYFRLSRWTKYVPQHVLLGTLGGVGVAFFKDYLSISTGISEEDVGTLEGVQQLLTAQMLPFWGSALGIYVLMRVLMRWDHRPYVIVAFLLVATAGFYVALWLSGRSIAEARDAGWLFPVNTIGEDVTGWQDMSVGQIHASKVFSQMGTIITLAMVAVLDLNVNVTFLDVETESDTNLDNEFRSHALANMLAALTLTIPNHLDMEKSVLRHESKDAARSTGFSVTLMFLLLVLIFSGGPDLCMAVLPRMVIGCLMLHFAVPLLFEVYVEARHHLSLLEYVTAIIMPVVMTVWGFLDGILLGILLACVFFVVQYGEVKTVRRTFTGVETRSLEWRPSRQQEKLIRHGKQVFGMQLEGYLFFGSVAEILKVAKSSVADEPDIRYMLLDFRLTQGMDNTAVASFKKLKILLKKLDIALIFCSLSPAVRDALEAGHCVRPRNGDGHGHGHGALDDLSSLESGSRSDDDDSASDASGSSGSSHFVDDGVPTDFENMNKALQWCEGTILDTERFNGDGRRRGNINTGAGAGAGAAPEAGSSALIVLVLGQQFPAHAPNLARLGTYLERRVVRQGDVIFSQGEPSRALYVLESGRLSVVLRLPDGGTKTIETLSHGGTMVGEIGLFTNATRGAALVCEADGVIFELSKVTLARMQREDTDLAFAVRDIVLTYVSHRLTGVNQSLYVQSV